jgi:ATP-dependent exoDNAse (exonuclease V) beta subunit
MPAGLFAFSINSFMKEKHHEQKHPRTTFRPGASQHRSSFQQVHACGSRAVLPVDERRPSCFNQEPLKTLHEKFEEVLRKSLENNADTPVIWKKNMHDQAATVAMGQSMLSAFYDSIDLSGYTVVEVELPLSARLYSDDGLPTDFMLVGILDLLLMDENDEAVVVDNKTAAQPMSQVTPP